MANTTYSTEAESKAYDWLTYPHDGPVTKFVLMSRATEAAAKGMWPPEEIANALHLALGCPE